MEKMNQKECINIKFSEGPGIFDNHYGYPEIDKQEKYNGPTGKVVNIQWIQAHAGLDFFFSYGKNLSFDIDGDKNRFMGWPKNQPRTRPESSVDHMRKTITCNFSQGG